MTEKERMFLLGYRLCEARLRKSGMFFTEAEILADFPYPQAEVLPRGQWCPVNYNDNRELLKGLTYEG